MTGDLGQLQADKEMMLAFHSGVLNVDMQGKLTNVK